MARGLGNPYWIAYVAVDRGHGVLASATPRACARGLGRGRGRRARAAGPVLRGLPRRATPPRLHTSDGGARGGRSALFADAIAAFQRAGNVPQLIITLASVPALFERLGRPEPAAVLLGALTNEPSSAHHVPELAELTHRVARDLGPKRREQLTADGVALDLGDAAMYARQQIDVARRDPAPATS